MTTVYKVVRRRRDGKLASAMMQRGRLVVIYEPQRPAHSLNGMKLLALQDRLSADFFHQGNERQQELQTWEAEATNPSKCPFLSWNWTWEGAKMWWASGKTEPRHSMATPLGTVACDSITLIKRVDKP